MRGPTNVTGRFFKCYLIMCGPVSPPAQRSSPWESLVVACWLPGETNTPGWPIPFPHSYCAAIWKLSPPLPRTRTRATRTSGARRHGISIKEEMAIAVRGHQNQSLKHPRNSPSRIKTLRATQEMDAGRTNRTGRKALTEDIMYSHTTMSSVITRMNISLRHGAEGNFFPHDFGDMVVFVDKYHGGAMGCQLLVII